ncbi:MAG: glycosyltransferase family 4 protein [Candidatus Bathyarchaeia archaeon]
MKIAFIHPHVVEDLIKFGISNEEYARHVGFEHRYAKLVKEGGDEADVIIFSRSIKKPAIRKHIWGHHILFIPITGVKILRVVRLIATLSRVLKDLNYDLVHCFSYYSNIYDAVALACKITGIPLVAQAQGIYPKIPTLQSLRKFFTLRLSSCLMPLNNSEAVFLRRKFKIRNNCIRIVRNFIDPSSYLPKASKEKCRAILGLPQDSFIILSVCRLVPQKGVQTILRAVSLLKNEIPEVLLVIVGEGPYRNVLERMVKKLDIQDYVRFVGYVHNLDIGKYYSSADCFVLASFEEGFGIAIIEAMYYGLPVLAASNWGSIDLIDHGVDGMLFKPGDYESLARLILQVYRNPQLCRILGERARQKVLTFYTSQNTYALLKEIYTHTLR